MSHDKDPSEDKGSDRGTPDGVDEALTQGFGHHRSGRLKEDEAISILRQSWYAQPMTAKGRFWPGGGIGALAAAVAWAWPAEALSAEAPAPLNLDIPIRCTPGETCWIIKYVDLDPTPGRLDYRCGRLSDDGHKGTDFAIRDLAVMRTGVDVLAAAAGTVVGTRDGMRDVNVGRIGGPEALKGKDCGNGVRIRHADDWSIQYCHRRKGSVAVKTGDKVTTGQHLGLVGLSGKTDFPHVHITVTHGKKVVDPFVGTGRREDCALGEKPLWKPDVLKQLVYRSVYLYNAGFAAAKPKVNAVRNGRHQEKVLSREAPALVLWVDTFWPRPGDELSFHITAPDGKTILRYRQVLKHKEARGFYFAGVRNKAKSWPAGVYRGEVRLVRENGLDGREEYSTTREVTLR